MFIAQTEWFAEVIEKDDLCWKNEMKEKLVNFWHYMSMEIIDSRLKINANLGWWQDLLYLVLKIKLPSSLIED